MVKPNSDVLFVHGIGRGYTNCVIALSTGHNNSYGDRHCEKTYKIMRAKTWKLMAERYSQAVKEKVLLSKDETWKLMVERYSQAVKEKVLLSKDGIIEAEKTRSVL